ncbi:hypothetical protein VYE96_08875 [Fusobacterium pseudoperiodonticum]|nr:hypothetical protein [Fusobacterium pseudoperiodonticum]
MVAFFKLSVGSSVSLNDLFDTDEYKKGRLKRKRYLLENKYMKMINQFTIQY